ncbi:MAG: ribonuclease P protein component [Patescibacteria group bacterium]|nr:ribonuclease P protein component [Patescibacteria group bacterium]
MLPSSNKIKTQLFKEILSKGKIYNSIYFSVKFLENPNGNINKFAVVVPKKVMKKAISRNLLRRRLFNYLKDLNKDLNKSFTIILFCKSEVDKLSFNGLKKEVDLILKKIGLFK